MKEKRKAGKAVKDVEIVTDSAGKKKMWGISSQVSKYNKSIISKTKKYISSSHFPSKAGLAVSLGISKRTVFYWEEKYPEWCALMDALMAKNEKVLLQKGMKGNINPTFAKFLLSASHGYTDKSEVNTNNKSITLNVNTSDSNDTSPSDLV